MSSIELCRAFRDSPVKHIGIQPAIVVALIDRAVIIRGWKTEAHLEIHDIHHGVHFFSVKLHGNILLEVVRGISLVAVERLLVLLGNFPHRNRNGGAFFGCDGSKGAMRLPFKLQLIIFDYACAVQFRAGTPVFHLTDIEIAAVGNIQSFTHIFFHSLHQHRKSRSVLLLLIRFCRFLRLGFYIFFVFLRMLFGKAFSGKPCFLRFRLRRVAPCDVAL